MFKMRRNLFLRMKPRSTGFTPNLFQNKCSSSPMANSPVTLSSENFGITRTSWGDMMMMRNGTNIQKNSLNYRAMENKQKILSLQSLFLLKELKDWTKSFKPFWKGMRMGGKTRFSNLCKEFSLGVAAKKIFLNPNRFKLILSKWDLRFWDTLILIRFWNIFQHSCLSIISKKE